ncbi:MAG TPA: hypothetical protein VF234_01355 [Limnochordia bacterium]
MNPTVWLALAFLAIALLRGAHLQADRSVAPPVAVPGTTIERPPPPPPPSDAPAPPQAGPGADALGPPRPGADPGVLPWPPEPGDECVYADGVIAFRWEYAPGEALETRIPLTDRTVRAVEEDIARAYAAWAVSAGAIGADMFRRKAGAAGVTLHLGEPNAEQPYLPIAGIDIDRPCP